MCRRSGGLGAASSAREEHLHDANRPVEGDGAEHDSDDQHRGEEGSLTLLVEPLEGAKAEPDETGRHGYEPADPWDRHRGHSMGLGIGTYRSLWRSAGRFQLRRLFSTGVASGDVD